MRHLCTSYTFLISSHLHTHTHTYPISMFDSSSHNPFVPLKVTAIGPDLAKAQERLSATAVSHLSQPLQHLAIDSHHMTSSTKCHLNYYSSPAPGFWWPQRVRTAKGRWDGKPAQQHPFLWQGLHSQPDSTETWENGLGVHWGESAFSIV